ncbi:hypothetical protein ACLGGT_05565 [Roseovarius sp. MS2]
MDKRARAGDHNFVNMLQRALALSDWTLDICTAGPVDTLAAADADAYALFLMQEPAHAKGLSLRIAYLMPFWRIERTAERWNFDVARTEFDPSQIDPAEATRFAKYWAKRKFDIGPDDTRRDGTIYVALQGYIDKRRSFQMASPLTMLRETLQRAEGRRVIAGLHPKEQYSDSDMRELEELRRAFPLLDVTIGGMETHLRSCDFVVTENSSVALMAMFFRKPAIVFARIDFHHTMLNVAEIGVDRAFDRVAHHAPEWDKYLLWFLKLTSVNAGAPEASDQIATRLKVLGWPLA